MSDAVREAAGALGITGGETETGAASPNVDAQAQEEFEKLVRITQQVCPGSELADLRENLPFIFRAMASAGLTSKNQIVGVIATIYVETTIMKPVPESGGGGRYEGWCEELGNCQPGDGDLYKGRGYIQLTGRANYERTAKISGIDLVNNPDLAMEPETAANIFMLYWNGTTSDRRCDEAAEAGDWPTVRLYVNGSSTGHNNDYGRVFKPCVDRGLALYEGGLDPALAGSIPLASPETTDSDVLTPVLAALALLAMGSILVPLAMLLFMH